MFIYELHTQPQTWITRYSTSCGERESRPSYEDPDSRDIRLFSTALLSFVMHSAMPAHWYMPATGQKSSAC